MTIFNKFFMQAHRRKANIKHNTNNAHLSINHPQVVLNIDTQR